MMLPLSRSPETHGGMQKETRDGQTIFPITGSVVKNAEKELSDWVVNSYRQQSEAESE